MPAAAAAAASASASAAPRSAPLSTPRASRRAAPRAAARCAASNTTNARFALLFDCDGVIVETEELHRRAYNASFEHYELTIDGVPLSWSVEYYDVLANTVGGGKPKMKWHFGKNGWPKSPRFFSGALPACEDDENALVDALQDKKTEFYKKIVEETAEARPGVLRLMDEAIADPSIAVGICSAATKAGFEKVVNSVVGPERLSKLDVIMAGDDVTRKKPDPLIYNLAREKVGLPASKCVVVEDSLVGLRAAVGADMPCLITPCPSSDVPDFKKEGAMAVCDDRKGLEGPPRVTVKGLFPEGAESPSFEGL